MPEAAILCIDDEQVILDSLKRQLRRRLGSKYLYEMVQSADDAWEALEELTSEGIRVLVIVSDWLMPGMKGDEFLIQAHAKYPSIVKILLTGQATEEAIERVRQEADLHRYLHKPWSEDELIDAITTGLDRI